MRARFVRPAHPGWRAFILLGTLAVFAMDLWNRTSVVTWIFYLIPLGATPMLTSRALPLAMAGLYAVLIVLDGLLLPEAAPGWLRWGNRALGILIICSFAIQARVFITARLRNRRRSWIRNARVRLGEQLAGRPTAAELGQSVISFLADYMLADSAVLYLQDEQGRARCLAGHAMPPHAAQASFATHEGAVGEVLGSARTLRLKPADGASFALAGTLGCVQPRELILSALTAQGRVVGVVELAFAEALSPADQELLESLGEPIGMALQVACWRTEREGLLRATQAQAEELRTQQEELRVSNEALEHHSQLLRDNQSRLETQQAELEQSNVQLEEQAQALASQNDELEATRRELLQQAEELTRTSQFKSQFLANMSHELRTPLNSALILAKLLADNAQGNLDAEQVQFANHIYAAGNDLLELISDILDLSKIEARQVDVRSESLPLSSVLETLEQTFVPVARSKRVQLRIECSDDCPQQVQTDGRHLRQILRNLLSNALKFTTEGAVTLRVAPVAGRNGWLGFAVQDTGIGVAPEQQALIFEPFRQADGTISRSFGGTGLGLSISRELAALLGGRIELHSVTGEGSTFTLHLPMQFTAAPAAVVQLAPPAMLAPPAFKTAPARLAVQPSGSARRPLLLIIQADAEMARMLASLASALQFDSVLANTAQEALAAVHTHRPMAIVLDTHLPDGDGLKVLEQLKREPRTRDIPVQVVCARQDSQQALQAGAAQVLPKPVEREQLLAALGELAGKAPARPRKVLIVEDHPLQRGGIQKLLASEQVQTVAVATAGEALQQLSQDTFDCMVLDLGLPDASGHEVLRQLAQDDRYGFPPVIIYTARSLSAQEEQQLRRYSQSIIIKGARSGERLLDEVTVFLQQVQSAVTQAPPAGGQRRDAVFAGRQVLLAEDDVRNVFALTRVLESHGMQVHIARNGQEALQVLQATPQVELVLMDIMMPQMDGLEAMVAIRAEARWTSLPIIALTAKAMSDDRQACLQAGASDYIPKPIDLDKLLSLLRIWLPASGGQP